MLKMYTIIRHDVREYLGLGIIEYAVAELINFHSYNARNKISWCFASKERMGANLGISPRSIFTIINLLIEKGLVEKDAETKYIRTTVKWHDAIAASTDNPEMFAQAVQNLHSHNEKSAQKGSAKSAHYNNNSNNKRDIIESPTNNSLSLNTVLNNKEELPPPVQAAIETPEDKAFKDFQQWLVDNAPSIAKMEQPFTIDQYLKLMKWRKEGKPGYSKVEVMEQLAIMHNKKVATKDNRSAFYTLTHWTQNRLNWSNQKQQ